ncbi:uncharacterized protein ACN63O_016552, partial [Diretmus argenteus]
MTKGVAGIGKTVLTQKFTLDWAEDRTNHNIHFMFPFTFRELNLLKGKEFSLVELLHHFFSETKEAEICSFDEFQVVLIFDGLDECRLPLDFHNNHICTDVTESTSVDVLLTNLIKGNLLPSARVWITTRPAAANQIPPECVDMVTEVRGFTDPQKEEYFMKRFRDQKLARRIISHIKRSRSLHIMCHIPVFCWITNTVLNHVLATNQRGEMPNTLTEMYIHFLVVQSKQGNVKYHGRAETDPHWTTETSQMIGSLGKLAFEQLEKGNLIFYESDLTECGIDIRSASVYSGVFTQIFKEERGLYQDQVFCFVHLSIQEFLAALHVFLSFITTGVNLLTETQSTSNTGFKTIKLKLSRNKPKMKLLLQSAVDKALQSPNGHLDLFLRFLLGFSLETNQTLLRGLVDQTGKTLAAGSRRELKCNVKQKFQCVFEGISKAGNPTLLNQIYTELYITEGGSGEVNEEHEVRQIETASRKAAEPETPITCGDIFKPLPGREEPIRTVMTKGVAGIGKTVLTQKFTLDWAEDRTNHNIHFMFPFTFRELNLLKGKEFSLVELLHHFFSETKEAEICSFEEFQVVLIFDGLDECRLPLDFHNNHICTDVTESTSVDVLLTNLIKGNLLPSARVWITTRPAAANQIPPECVDMVTEVRGFTDPQKEEYFMKRFRDQKLARRIISHIKRSRSLHIMCHIPVFCWITNTVLNHVLATNQRGEMPNTLTEMYIHFLVVQSKQGNVKYHGRAETDPHWTTETSQMIGSLGKLAFEQLEKGNLIFYESDLTECGIDIRSASVYSGVFTQIFKEERGLYQDQVFCFVHLSIQEFLAALHVFLSFITTGVNLLTETQSTSNTGFKTIKLKLSRNKPKMKLLLQSAVDKALQSPNGHLDLFLRFLLGFSLETNQTLLRGLVDQTGSSSQTNQTLLRGLKFQCVFEGISKAGNPTLLNQIYTELYITEGGSGEVNEEHEVRQIETASRKAAEPETPITCGDIFKPLPGREEPIRTVMTRGVAGMGKTVLTQKFTLDWAEDQTNHNIHFIFPFTFRELNLLKGKEFSLVELLQHFFIETKEAEICSFDEFQVVLIFDGLDECRLPLDFHNNQICTDVTESTSVDVLLTNLIKGNLLPSARVWITTRPAAANQIPPECVDVVTEVRGFTDPQKEEYFRKRITDQKLARRIISHIKRSRTLHIMCHIPVFCWITNTVLNHVLATNQRAEMPNTLTEMYIHFLVVQSKQGNVKYHGRAETDPHWTTETRKMIGSLGKLAFEQLEKGNLIFYESDLTECVIDIRSASVYSGVFTQIFKEERGLYQDQVFCFVHLSVQEFLAALHVFLSFVTTGVNLLTETQSTSNTGFKTMKLKLAWEKPKMKLLLQSAVDKALQSPNGHLDLFLRFLLGFSLETNQTLLRGLVDQTGSSSQTNQTLLRGLVDQTGRNPTLLNQIYTELYITEGGSGEVNEEHEVRQIETASRKPVRPETTITCEDLFKPLPGREEPIRTVMTKGVAGIGKTVLTQKFTLDWAEDQTNHNIHFIFPFTFRELNLLKGKEFSLVELLHHFFIETKEAEICSFDEFQVVLIFDGLDECRLPLDFHNNQICTDVTESTSVDVLLTNLIKGNLLPSARVWITTRPAAANQIPPECVDVVTEVRGFTDPQKEEYFRKRITDQKLARRIISHIKRSRTLHIMCHIPVFCWITNTVLNHVLATNQRAEMPNTLTEMYIHFLVVQSKQGNVKYHGRAETDPHWTTETRKMIGSLGKLAFEQLEKGNLIFYESDLTECVIDIRSASVYSGVFTQIFKEERGLYQDQVFCFVHLSVQEFLAALHVFLSFITTGVNLLTETQSTSNTGFKTIKLKLSRNKPKMKLLLQSAVDKALQSPNGHLDLFLRFLLGFSLETNQTLLRGLVDQTGRSSSQTNQETVQYIKEKIRENPSPERSINLFHCLNELNDRSLVEEIQREEPIRTVMTKGVAGIGKTVLTQKFTLDWAEDQTNHNIHFIFPFTFRELNLLKGKEFSLVELLHHFFIETKEAEICSFDEFQVVLIFDGLDECRLPLDFHNNQICTDVTESTSVDVLLTNLIKGNLLPSARVWITTRPAAANQIPPECVDVVTEVRGFTDPQKEEYFRKRITDQKLARRIISHIKRSRTLHIMCHIPVFCWITNTVLNHVLATNQRAEMPNTLTEMYIHFLVVQSKQGNVKYHGRAETDPHWTTETRKMIRSLGKLAFEQLEKGNLIFYESDLTECVIDIRSASVYSGVFTQIFKEERGLYQDQVFCFVHLSVQEFLAALHVFLSFITTGVNLLTETQSTSNTGFKTIKLKLSRNKPKMKLLLQSAVDKALQSPNGHLDLFLRFLLGFSLETNQTLLRGLVDQTGSSSQTNQTLLRGLKFQCVFEGISKAGNPTLLNQIYTELYITEGGSGEVNEEHEVRQIETASRKPVRPETTITCEDLFKPLPGREEPIRTVMTKGVAGIGKTVLTQKFTLDWAEDQTNHNIHFIFPFTFRELNLLKGKEFSLVELLHHFFIETKEAEICSFDEFQVVLIFDGLDECRLPLDFHNNQICTDVTESTSVDVLLTNLIKGNLLPSARVWITTRPAAANQIPPECVDVVTEVRGFTDPQKEEYFRKRITDQKLARRIISHIKRSRTLHIMCHIPVFCWITNTVLNHVLATNQRAEMPNTLTEMYIHFLVVQSKQGNVKYHGRAETDPHWTTETRKMIGSLGKLAFEQLEKGNLIFYESDLTECVIDIRSASVYSGVFTQIFKEERGLYQDQVFCFVHLSVQEFLAALHVFLSFITTGVNLLTETQSTSNTGFKTIKLKLSRNKPKMKLLLQSAVDKALQSPNGHLDLFLRFLLGFSLETNQTLLRGLVDQTGRNPTLLNQIYTELYITEGGSGEVNEEHEVRQIETASRKPVRPETTITCEDLFKPLPGREEPIRTVMTKGVAGIGKTVLTQKFTLDWAEDQTNHNIHFIFPFTFRELNLLKGKEFSLVELLHHFFIETKEAEICSFDEFQVVLIFDGLDECRLPLDFHNNQICTDVTESTSVDVLLTNLIKGNLLPSARVWITTRPAAANQIPPECVDVVTEVRGFTDPQKEEYFRKRITDQKLARRIISHIKRSRTLHIMCHIPVFCWITNTVLNHVLATNQRAEMPNTLTEMYIHFLVVQSKQGNVKYHGRAETDPHWTTETRKMIGSLGKLAFEQLEKGNLIFYESDLTECVIDIRSASVYSGVFTQIFKEERGLYQDQVFCFVHLSVQEFLAALHVFLSFITTGVNLLTETQSTSNTGFKTIKLKLSRNKPKMKLLLQSAVDKALQSPNGHLDLFLRFLLGFSLETNQTLLRGLVDQ